MSLFFQGEIEISDGKIVSLKPGSGSVKLIIAGKAKYEFKNSTAFPGFVDSHGHVAGYGNELSGLTLNSTSSALDCIERAKKMMWRAGEWIQARGWNQEHWPEKQFPDCKILDEHFPDNPVYFTRVDGHAAWVNSLALKIAGITSKTREVYGGIIHRFPNGEPSGILIDNAMNLVMELLPPIEHEKIKKYILAGLYKLVESGITETHDMDVFPEHHSAYMELAAHNKLPIRVRGYLKSQNDEWQWFCEKPIEIGYYKVAGIKLYADGALGSRGAAMHESYSDRPEESGVMLLESKDIYQQSSKAIEKGFDVAIHAIGDMAVSECLDAFEAIRRKYGKKPVLRIEHAQNVIPEDIARMRKSNVIASVQPVHFYQDAGEMAPARLGPDRLKNAYRWKSLLKAGITLLGGSDYPIESENPLRGIETFINRLPADGNKNLWDNSENLSLAEALNAYCLNPRKAIGIEKRGFIEEGFDADLTIISGNPEENFGEEIACKKVLLTLIGGKAEYISDRI